MFITASFLSVLLFYCVVNLVSFTDLQLSYFSFYISYAELLSSSYKREVMTKIILNHYQSF